jgi:hypothetical protein
MWVSRLIERLFCAKKAAGMVEEGGLKSAADAGHAPLIEEKKI